MKKLVIVFIFITAIISCQEKALPELTYSDYILAGESFGNRLKGIYYNETGIGWVKLENDTNSPEYKESYSLDINEDGIKDYTFHLNYFIAGTEEFVTITLTPLGENEVITSIAQPGNLMPIAIEDTINRKNNWSTESSIIHKVNYTSTETIKEGLFLLPDNRNEYIGVKTKLDNKDLYGWIRISKTWGDGIWIFNFATTIGY